MENVMLALTIAMEIVGSALVPRIWWTKSCTSCAHDWQEPAGPSGTPGREYECRDCGARLTRRDDQWPPICSERGSCGWPHCTPLRTNPSLRILLARSFRRAAWYAADAPE